MTSIYIRFATVLFVLFISLNDVHAQSNPNIGLGAEFGLPSGNFSGLSAVGLGASVKADLPISTDFVISLNAGFMNFFGKKNQLINVQDLTYAPLKAGLKYILGENFYAEGQLGVALALNNGQKTVFVWSPGIGSMFDLAGGKNKIDLGIRYEAWIGKNNSAVILNNSINNKGFVGLRVAYVFGL